VGQGRKSDDEEQVIEQHRWQGAGQASEVASNWVGEGAEVEEAIRAYPNPSEDSTPRQYPYP
jgi:hypothetical protein